jgi:hypothetical protein
MEVLEMLAQAALVEKARMAGLMGEGVDILSMVVACPTSDHLILRKIQAWQLLHCRLITSRQRKFQLRAAFSTKQPRATVSGKMQRAV